MFRILPAPINIWSGTLQSRVTWAFCDVGSLVETIFAGSFITKCWLLYKPKNEEEKRGNKTFSFPRKKNSKYYLES